jgi:hypothetical protein
VENADQELEGGSVTVCDPLGGREDFVRVTPIVQEMDVMSDIQLY